MNLEQHVNEVQNNIIETIIQKDKINIFSNKKVKILLQKLKIKSKTIV